MDINDKRYWDLPAVLLLVAALWVSALRLWVTDWTPHLDMIELLVLFGALIGLALGKSSFRPKVVHWIGFLYTLFFMPWQIGTTIDSASWPERLNSLAQRMNDTTYYFLRNRPVQDPILFLTSMALLFWLVSLIASYQLVRYGKPWITLAVTALAVILVEYYNPYTARASLLTGVFMFFMLMLIGRVHYLFNRQNWEENHVAVDAETGFDLSRGTIVTGLVLVVMAWNFPTLVKAITPGTKEQRWVQVSWQGLRNRLSNAVVSLQSPVIISNSDFGNNLGLGTGAMQGDDVVMTVTPLKPYDPQVRLYMRGRTYDSYLNGGWINSITNQSPVKSETKVANYPNWNPSAIVDLSVKNGLPNSRTLYSPGRPIKASRTAKAQIDQISEQEVDVVSLLADTPMQSGDSYTIEGAVMVPTIAQLRSSPETYPDWVIKEYLQLPEKFSPRLAQLAKDLTANMDNPYDKTEAITEYLRKNIKYSTSVPIAPTNVDPLEWFVFSYKQGFCNYYASAEVVMLRSIGIPARLAVGYAEGQPVNNGQSFLVRRKDSHAWPEVYFYGAGWVVFEPTVSQPDIQLEAGTDPNTQQNQSATNSGSLGDVASRANDKRLEEANRGDPVSTSTVTNSFPYQWVVLGVLLAGALALGLFIRRQRSLGLWRPVPQLIERNIRRRGWEPPLWLQNWARFTDMSPIERIFAGIPYMLRFQGAPTSANQTPTEQVQALTSLVPEAAQQAGIVLEEYQRSIYSPYLPDVEQARQANNLLWRQVLRNWIRKRFGVEIQVT